MSGTGKLDHLHIHRLRYCWEAHLWRKSDDSYASRSEVTIFAITFYGSILIPPVNYSPITYYWTVPLILDHSYLVGRSTSSKIAETKVSGF
jgi:hypothetical protein